MNRLAVGIDGVAIDSEAWHFTQQFFEHRAILHLESVGVVDEGVLVEIELHFRGHHIHIVEHHIRHTVIRFHGQRSHIEVGLSPFDIGDDGIKKGFMA